MPASPQTLVPRREIAYVRDPSGAYHWTMGQGREWVFDDGVLYIVRGVLVVPVTLVPDWQSAMQWTCGFDAGRDLPIVATERAT